MNNEEIYNKAEELTYRATVLGTLTRIEGQTIKTNGRVNSLENWRWFLTGMGVLIVTLLIPILIALIQSGKL